MSTLPENSGQGEISRFFGIDPAAFYSTGGGSGSGGVDAVSDTGTALASVIVTVPGASSQPAQPVVTVNTSSTEVPVQAAEYNKTEPFSKVPLATGGYGPDGNKFGQWAADLDQSTFHPNSNGKGPGVA